MVLQEQGSRKENKMKRTIGVLVATCLVVLLSAGTALAASPLIIGTNSGEQITGTSHAEEIRGLGGSDEISDGWGKDLVYGGAGEDNLIGTGGDTSVDYFYGGRGGDLFQPRDVPAVKDKVSCGGGTDSVYADKADVVGGNCERVKAW
jgi:Ca2+-binding RTX toxin-like protein